MAFLPIIASAGAAWLFGAVWYMLMAGPWMQATGLSERDVDRKDPLPYLLSLVFLTLVAGMTSYIFVLAGVNSVSEGFWTGLGLGLFVGVPWMASSYMFAKQPMHLMLIDGIYAMIGNAIIGVGLTLF